jgi:ribonuclease PH
LQSEYSELAEVRCDVKLATFAGELRKTPGQTDEERGWSLALQGALEAAVLLRRYPKAAIDVFVLVLEEDGSVLASAINAASLALADAGIEMRDLVGAVSVGVGPEGPVIDLSRAEEKKNGGGLTVAALCGAGTVVQMQSHAGSSALAAQGLPLLLSFALEAVAQLKPVWATALARE